MAKLFYGLLLTVLGILFFVRKRTISPVAVSEAGSTEARVGPYLPCTTVSNFISKTNATDFSKARSCAC